MSRKASIFWFNKVGCPVNVVIIRIRIGRNDIAIFIRIACMNTELIVVKLEFLIIKVCELVSGEFKRMALSCVR